ncbi:hypothetical protein [Thermanaerothrix daxensis]|nr:hypothetical protein [Thermanaerothrix daxensis]
MKRLFARAVTVALILVLISSVVVLAAPRSAATPKSLSTNYTLVNMGKDNAVVNVQYYKDDGTTWQASPDSTSFTIPGNFGQRIVAQYFDTTMSPGRGAAVIQSSQPLGAVVQILARNQTATSGAYSGFVSGSSRLFVPLVSKNRATASGTVNSQIVIQNIEQTGDIMVDIQFVAQSGYSDYTKSGIIIKQGSSYYWDATEESGLPNGWTGTAVINVRDGKKAVAVSNRFAGANGLLTFSAFPQELAYTEWAVPLFASRLANGLSVTVSIQNVSGSTIGVGEIRMDCKSSISTPASFSISNSEQVTDGAAYYFNPVQDLNIPGNWSGACRVISPKNVVVIAQMRRPNITEGVAAYEAFRTDSRDTKVVIPLMSKRQPNGFSTVATIQNLDPLNEARVKLTYTPSPTYPGSQTPIVLRRTIPAGGNLIQNLRFSEVSEIPDGWYGTLVVEPDDGQPGRPIVGFVQLTNYQDPPIGDKLMAHDAFTLP